MLCPFQQVGRTCSTEAWASRPINFRGTLRDAVAHMERTEEEDRRRVARVGEFHPTAQLAARKAAHAAVPEWCYPHEHPLGVGDPQTLYSKYDYIQPIRDSISRLRDRIAGATGDVFGLWEPTAKRRRVSTRDELLSSSSSAAAAGASAADAASAAPPLAELTRFAATRLYAPGVPEPVQWKCPQCKNTNLNTLVHDKESTACPCGVVVAFHGPMVDTHRERLGAKEEDDATQHADSRTRGKTHAEATFDRAPVSRDQTRNERLEAARMTNVAARVKGLGRMCDAKALVDKERARDTQARSELSSREEVKCVRILEAAEELFKTLGPVDFAVKRQVRMAVDALWTDAVRHSHACRRARCCELRLVDRSPFIIATSVFAVTVDRIIDGRIEAVGTRREHILELQTRMHRSAEFNNASSLTQMCTARAMISLMQTEGFDPKTLCVDESEPVQAPAPVRPVQLRRSAPCPLQVPVEPIPGLVRCESTLSNMGDCTPTSGSQAMQPVQFRDAVARVWLAYNSELPLAVRAGTLRAVKSARFVAECRRMATLRGHGIDAVAFCAINAVAREQHERAVAPASFAQTATPHDQINVPIAQRLKLDLAVAEESITAMRPLVPLDAAAEADTSNDDDMLF